MGILVRSGPLSHPDVRRTIEQYFVPVALDILQYADAWQDIEATADATPGGAQTWVAPPIDSDEIDRFRRIRKQADMSQGIWLATPDGTVLRNYYGLTAQSVLATMNAAIKDYWSADGRLEPALLARSSGGEQPFTDNTALILSGRLVNDSDAGSIFHDRVVIDPASFVSLAGYHTVGKTIAVPDSWIQSIASRLYPGEMRLVVREEEIVRADGQLTITEAGDQRVRARLTGSVTVEGTFPFSQRRRRHQAELSGELCWRVDPPGIESCSIVSDGLWQGEYPGGVLTAASEIYPGGRRDLPLAMSPPMRLLFLIETPNDRTIASRHAHAREH